MSRRPEREKVLTSPVRWSGNEIRLFRHHREASKTVKHTPGGTANCPRALVHDATKMETRSPRGRDPGGTYMNGGFGEWSEFVVFKL